MRPRARSRHLAALSAILLSSGCGPAIGERVQGGAAGPGLVVAITGASIGDGRRVVVHYGVTENGKPVAATAAAALAPKWTLAELGAHPMTGLPAWRSELLTGEQVIPSLPVGGPGTPQDLVSADVRQPGYEDAGAVTELGDGTYSYTFQQPLPEDLAPGRTLRVGVWLDAAEPTASTTSTFDFVPAGGPAAVRESVLAASCEKCHGLVKAHASRTGVKICVTCHTSQNADPDTLDPAAMSGATPATNPNPLELGVLVHRVHRGRLMPTLYRSSSTATAPALPSRDPLPLPFSPQRSVPVVGQRFSIVAAQREEHTFGEVVTRVEGRQPGIVTTNGVRFPLDLRNCAACHGGAADGAEVDVVISRRTCQGCHPDVWFGQGSTDEVHLAHPGGPRPDDAACPTCHVASAERPAVYASIRDLHVAPASSTRLSPIELRIVAVRDVRPGMAPTIVFTVSDRNGPLRSLVAPDPAADPTSPIGRRLTTVAVTLSGPTSSASGGGTPATSPTDVVLTGRVSLSLPANEAGEYAYTFPAPLPAQATGTWSVGMEAMRAGAAPHYVPATDTFPWPGTGEQLVETANNPIVLVALGDDGQVVERPAVVAGEKCNGCHGQLAAHGGLRTSLQYCLMCHTPAATDWNSRPKGPDGNTNLAATFDGLEERSVRFSVLVHRIHTGARTGSAELGARPLVVYGYPRSFAYFLDDVRFPNALSDCAVCHVDDSFLVESLGPSAPATVANESKTILHHATAEHGAGEAVTPPVQSSCLGCHGSGAARLHAEGHTAPSGREQCGQCHGAAASASVRAVHAR